MNGDINNDLYHELGHRWYTAMDDPVALLRAESLLKGPWIMDRIKKLYGEAPVSLLDVGCGGGFNSNHFAKQGLVVSGVDVSESSLEVARCYDETRAVNYQVADAYQLPFADASFEVITLMDFLEHVEEPARAIREASRVLKPGGLLFFSTLNRNFASYWIGIRLVEFLVKNTPKDMHVLRLFIKPKELRSFCKDAGLETSDWVGMRPVISSIPLKNLVTGVVPESFRFAYTRCLLISYMGYARKK